MFGGQHRSDELTRAERVGWTRIRSTTEIDPSSNRALLRKRMGVPAWKKKIHSGKEKDEKPS